MNILLTAIGKRVQLIKHLKKSCSVFGTDCSSFAPAAAFADKFYLVPRYDEAGYIERLISICKNEKINMLVPLFEKEYKLLCKHRNEFEKAGTILLLSSENVIKCCNDKFQTYKFFKDNDINTPLTFSQYNIPDNISFPLIIKPADGMGSAGVFKVNDNEELSFSIKHVKNPIIQQYIEGTEYTVDVLCDLNGNIISIVPRERLEVRAGEVSKSRTVNDEQIINRTYELCRKLNGIGPLTVQCIKTSGGGIYFIEINPRFGGGVPLTFEAGVDYGSLLCSMADGEDIKPLIGQFKQLTMLRYDEAVYL